MNYTIRKGTKKDMASVLKLIQELATFELEPNAVVVTESDLIRDGFCDNPLFKTFVAELNDEIVGMALFYPRYSSWKGPTIHLEDLIVAKNKRGLKLGKALYDKVIEYGFKKGVNRIEWVVLDWNKTAISFYEKSGAVILEDWKLVQIEGKSIEKHVNTL